MGATGSGARLRQRLLDAVRGAGFADDLAELAAWQTLVMLWHTGWLGDGRGSERALTADVRRRFRAIAQARTTLANADGQPPGSVVVLRGTIGAQPAARGFLLEDSDGHALVVHTEGARVVGRDTPDHAVVPAVVPPPAAGASVTVVGFVDRIIDPSVPAAPRRPPWRSIVRSGDTLPLIVIVIR